MLMRAYYRYEKSSKKCHELNEVVASLRECLEKRCVVSGLKGIDHYMPVEPGL